MPWPIGFVVKNGSKARCDHVRRHARARVGDADRHVLARRHVPLRGRIGVVEMRVAVSMVSLPPSGMASRALIARLRIALSSWLGSHRVVHSPPAVTISKRMQRADGAAQQVLHGGDELVGVDRLRIERLAAREGEQAVGQGGGALGRAHRGLGVALDVLRPSLRDAGLHEVEGADDAGEQVVEVVGDAAGELAHRLHLLGLAQRLLGVAQGLGLLLLARDVAADGMNEPLVRDGRPGQPPVRSVLVAIAVLEPQCRDALGQPPGLGDCRGQIVRVNEVEEALAEEFILAPAEQDRPGRVDCHDRCIETRYEHDVSGKPPHPVPVGCPLGDLLRKRHVQLANGFARCLLILDVRIGADPAHYRTTIVSDWNSPRNVPTVGAIHASQSELGLVVGAGGKGACPALGRGYASRRDEPSWSSPHRRVPPARLRCTRRPDR